MNQTEVQELATSLFGAYEEAQRQYNLDILLTPGL
jgi:hypothetical protein